jgi:hypothetical protein
MPDASEIQLKQLGSYEVRLHCHIHRLMFPQRRVLRRIASPALAMPIGIAFSCVSHLVRTWALNQSALSDFCRLSPSKHADGDGHVTTQHPHARPQGCRSDQNSSPPVPFNAPARPFERPLSGTPHARQAARTRSPLFCYRRPALCSSDRLSNDWQPRSNNWVCRSHACDSLSRSRNAAGAHPLGSRRRGVCGGWS